MENDVANSCIGKSVIGEADNHFVGNLVEEGSQQVGVLQIGVVAEADNLAAVLEAQANLEFLQPLEVGKTLKLTKGVENLVQQAALFSAQLLTEERERLVSVFVDIAGAALCNLDGGTEGCQLQRLYVFLDGAHTDGDAQLVECHQLVQLLRETVHVVVMMMVGEQSVEILVAYECVFVDRHRLWFFCCKYTNNSRNLCSGEDEPTNFHRFSQNSFTYVQLWVKDEDSSKLSPREWP